VNSGQEFCSTRAGAGFRRRPPLFSIKFCVPGPGSVCSPP
jgi:hypothetical protein